jgi:hypothetical protein
VGRGSYSKPDGGPTTPLVHSGSTAGMEWVELMELYRGQGLYLLCQLPLVDKYTDEPMARELLARIMNYLGGVRFFRQPTARLEAIVARGTDIEKRLAEAGVAYEVVSGSTRLTPSSVALVDASVKTDEASRRAWAAALKAGATVIVCNAQPTDAPWLSVLAGRTVALTIPPYRMWEGRGYRTGFDPLTAGVSQVDLHWRQKDGAESAARQAEDGSLTIEPLMDFAVQAEGAAELVFPGALVRLQVGKGILVIDQRRWSTTHEKLVNLAHRQVAALMLGLGVQMAPVTTTRSLPANVVFQTMDLGLLANRALADEVAEDGQGGWTDQGPNADLRTLARGKHHFQGVPFVLADSRKDGKSCIVLSSDLRPFPNNLPTEVTIPIGQVLEGLYFLHGFAYTGEGDYAGLYQIQYADGTSVDIPLYGETNVRDWISAPGPFVREKGTTSSIAWTGSCPRFRQIALYKMLWVNPRPEAAIRAVRFANPSRKCVPVLLALTGIVAKEAKSPSTPAAAQKARDLLAQALQAVQDHDDAKARGLLRDSIAADPSLATAHQALCDLYERAGDENASLAAYKAWVKAGAYTPLPYNRIGLILENRKDYKAALEAYTRSLRIEWNQPPIIEKKARLEKETGDKSHY